MAKDGQGADLTSLPKEELSRKAVLVEQQGFWLPSFHFQGINNAIQHFKPLPTDILLASFPKTGTTWLKALVFSIVNRFAIHHLAKEHTQTLVPFLEVDVYGENDQQSFPLPTSNHWPRIFHTHIPYQLLANKVLNPLECRIVYVMRNPKDTLLSTWFFLNQSKRLQVEPWPLEVAAERFCSGVVGYGPYHDHVMEYKMLSVERPNNVLFLTYEDLKSDPNTHVKNLAEFLGRPFRGDDIDEQVQEVVTSCSFEMLSNYEENKSTECFGSTPFRKSSYFRKGQIGDYNNYLTVDMVEKIDALTRENFILQVLCMGFNLYKYDPNLIVY